MINRKLIFLAIFLSFITTMAVYFYLQKVQSGYAVTAYEKIVVAKTDIPAKVNITGDMVELKGFPKDFIHPNALFSLDDVIGKLAGDKIYAGEPVLSPKVVSKGESNKGLAYIIPTGKRAVSVAVNDVSGVAGLIKPGDKIDVIATMDLDSNNIGRVVQTGYVLQNIEVLAVNKNMEENGVNETGNESQRTVTLAVNPSEATPLILATEKGSVRLILRGHNDEEVKGVPVYRLSNFLKEGE